MSFPPATPMSFARILCPRPGFVYDRVTYPNLPQFAETLTSDRYNGNSAPCAPFARCYPEYPQNCESLQTNPFGGLGMLGVPVSWGVRAAANGLGALGEPRVPGYTGGSGGGSARCIDPSTIFTVDATELVFSWRLLNAAGGEEQFTSPPVAINRLFGRVATVTGHQLVRAALRRFSRGRVGVSPVCITYAHRTLLRHLLGLGGLGATAAQLAHEAAMRNATASGGGGGSGGSRAPLPPGTTKTPMQAAGAAVANLFGTGPTLPPGTTAEGDAGEGGETTNASPPVSSVGAPNWGLYVGLSVAAVAAVALIAVLTKKPSVANRRRNRRRRNGKHRGAIKGFRVNDLVQYTHADDRRTHAGYQGRIIELSPLSALVDWGHRKGSYWVPYNRLMQV